MKTAKHRELRLLLGLFYPVGFNRVLKQQITCPVLCVRVRFFFLLSPSFRPHLNSSTATEAT